MDTTEELDTATATARDGRVRRGDLTRSLVLQKAVEVASVVGLDGLSIGQLAGELSISKSGLFAHFGAKEELQLATLRAARRIYAASVVRPAQEADEGLDRLWALSLAWLEYSRTRVFPGGCFFAKAAHDFAARPGPVRDAVVAANREWLEILRAGAEDARRLGQLRSDVDPAQLAFELNALYETANLGSLLGDDEVYVRAEASIRERLREAAAAGARLPWESV